MENLYESLKLHAREASYEQLGLPATKEEVLYGVVMDWDFEGRAIITPVHSASHFYLDARPWKMREPEVRALV